MLYYKKAKKLGMEQPLAPSLTRRAAFEGQAEESFSPLKNDLPNPPWDCYYWHDDAPLSIP